jgi:hypothetical protein
MPTGNTTYAGPQLAADRCATPMVMRHAELLLLLPSCTTTIIPLQLYHHVLFNCVRDCPDCIAGY